MKKSVFRFHRHAWTDIEVEAENAKEAQELADSRYCDGDYEDNDDDFENTEVELMKETEA